MNVESDWRGGAVDMAVCGCRDCFCGTCRVCGFPMHSAVHGPVYGQPPGSKPYDHEYVPGGRPRGLWVTRKAAEVTRQPITSPA